MPFNPFGAILVRLDEVLVGIANLSAKIGVLIVSTQQDAANLAQAIADDTSAWQAWAAKIQTVLNNVETALTAAQANSNVDLTDAQNAVAAAQAAVGALPVVPDPTVTPPAPAPTPTPGS